MVHRIVDHVHQCHCCKSGVREKLRQMLLGLNVGLGVIYLRETDLKRALD